MMAQGGKEKNLHPKSLAYRHRRNEFQAPKQNNESVQTTNMQLLALYVEEKWRKHIEKKKPVCILSPLPLK